MASHGGVKVSIKPPMKVVQRRYDKVVRGVKNGKSRNKLAAIYLDSWVQRNFKTSGKNVGGWKPLAAGGRFKGGKFDPNAKVLMDTGRLRLSFNPYSTNATAGIFSGLKYAEAHEKGLKGLPERRMLPIKKEVIGPIKKIYKADLANKFKRFNRA